MVRRLAAFSALFFFSCGGPRLAAPDSGAYDDRAPDDPEIAEARFNEIERLIDNPVDPRRARAEDLLAIPGFPPSLADNVIEAVRESRPGRSWIEGLTPPDRAALYRYEGLILLPERKGAACMERLTADKLDVRGDTRLDSYAAASGEGWRLVLRSRDFDARRKTSFYASASALSGTVLLHAGSLAPCFGFGLVFGGSGPDVLSSGYPFGGNRWIAGSASFSERVLNGGAAELYVGHARAALVGGRARVFGKDRFELEGDPVFGGRFQASSGPWEGGAAAFRGLAPGPRPLYSVDGAWKGTDARVGFEIAGSGRGDPACAWGASYRARKARAGVLLHAAPAGVCGPWGQVNGRTLAASRSERGAAASAEIEPLRRLHVRGSFEEYVRDDGGEEKAKDALRLECEKSWSPLTLKLSWSSGCDAARGLVPYPGGKSPERSSDDAYSLSCGTVMADWAKVRISARYEAGKGRRGIVVSPVLLLSLLSDALKAECSLASCRALEGKPVHYFSEPSLSGMIPWAVASGDCERASFLISYKINRLAISSKAMLESGRPPEGALQAVLSFG